MRRALALVLLAACGWPEGLPGTAAPGAMPGGAEYPDLFVDAGAPVGGSHDTAVIVAIEHYTHLHDRPGALAMAAAWYRYFRVSRGMAPGGITLLRDAEATPKRLARALEKMRRRGRHGALWFIVIGHVSSGADGSYGDLWLSTSPGTSTTRGHAFDLSRALARIAHGHHASAVAVLDGCLAGASASGTATPAMPRYQTRIRTAAAATRSEGGREWSGSSRVHREPADVAVFSAGLGDGCVERLPGTLFPALSYLMLGGLRGWADRDGDGNVGAVELLRTMTVMLRTAQPGHPQPQPRLYGANLSLARRVSEAGPRLAQLRPAGSEAGPGGAASTEAAMLAEPLAWTADPMIGFDRGSFVMGCARRGDPDCERDERPTYRVKLSRFDIDPLEVTHGEYQQCVDAGACSPLALGRCYVWTGETFARGARLAEPLTRADHPVVCVDWFQAERYCDALDKHLPTEAEWERVAAGQTRRRYPWGDAEPSCARAHFDGCGEHTHPVGAHATGATPEGVQDLAGNVSEWVHDWYDKTAYTRPLRDDPTGPSVGRVRVVRGGSYYDNAALLRGSYRYGLSPGAGFSTVGFRCAR